MLGQCLSNFNMCENHLESLIKTHVPMEVHTGQGGYVKRELSVFHAGDD